MRTPSTWPGKSTGKKKKESRKALALARGEEIIRIGPGEFRIGRSSQCEICLDDNLVSRVHGRVRATPEAIILEDLGSRNGVLLNGMHIDGPTPIRDGDRVLFGATELRVISVAQESRADPKPLKTPKILEVSAPSAPPPRRTTPHRLKIPVEPHAANATDVTKKANRFAQLSPMVERLIDDERLADASMVLSGNLQQFLEGAREGTPVQFDVLDAASYCAIKIATAGGEGKWLNTVIELHLIARRPMRGPLIDKLTHLMGAVEAFDQEQFAAYQAVLRTERDQMTLVDRVLASQILALVTPVPVARRPK